MASLIAWRNAGGELLLLDGHARWNIFIGAEAEQSKSTALNLAALPPQIVEIELPSRDAALLWVIDNQTGRRNLTDLQRIALAAKREDIIRRMAKANQGTRTDLSAQAPKSSPIDSRRECAKLAGVGEHTYDAGKRILDAVADGTLPDGVVADINAGTKSIHGVAKSLKTGGKPASKSKSSGWQKLVSVFSKAVRSIIKRDPNRRVEVAASLHALADELQNVKAAA